MGNVTSQQSREEFLNHVVELGIAIAWSKKASFIHVIVI